MKFTRHALRENMFDLLGSNFYCTGPDVVWASMLVFILQERESGLNVVYKLQAQSSTNE